MHECEFMGPEDNIEVMIENYTHTLTWSPMMYQVETWPYYKNLPLLPDLRECLTAPLFSIKFVTI